MVQGGHHEGPFCNCIERGIAACLARIDEGKGNGQRMMVKLEQKLSRHILAHCPARTDQALRDRFGISYNTLRKIEAGRPIRGSLARRLRDRLADELPLLIP